MLFSNVFFQNGFHGTSVSNSNILDPRFPLQTFYIRIWGGTQDTVLLPAPWVYYSVLLEFDLEAAELPGQLSIDHILPAPIQTIQLKCINFPLSSPNYISKKYNFLKVVLTAQTSPIQITKENKENSQVCVQSMIIRPLISKNVSLTAPADTSFQAFFKILSHFESTLS